METTWIQPKYDLETISLLLGCELESKIFAFNVLQSEAGYKHNEGKWREKIKIFKRDLVQIKRFQKYKQILCE